VTLRFRPEGKDYKKTFEYFIHLARETKKFYAYALEEVTPLTSYAISNINTAIHMCTFPRKQELKGLEHYFMCSALDLMSSTGLIKLSLAWDTR